MGNLRSQLRVMLFAAGVTLLAGLTLALLAAGALFVSTPPVKAQLAGWTDGLFSGVLPPTYRVTNDAVPFIPVTGGDPAVQAGGQPTPPSPTLAPTTPALTETPTVAPTEAPVVPEGRLLIPTLGIDQSILPVPVIDGDWDVSGLTGEIGWLETTGAKPFDHYAMVFASHVTLPEPYGPGPFHQLRTLEAGDEIRFRTAEAEYIYWVDGRDIVPPDSVDRLFLADGEKIVLVTCSDWNYLAQQYDYRLVVEASLTQIAPLSAPVE
ncbi:MAG TPA: class F sortase [Anaerolineaceae bacterium]|nr:class F sortase [Anaerolineaceae bacterium]